MSHNNPVRAPHPVVSQFLGEAKVRLKGVQQGDNEPVEAPLPPTQAPSISKHDKKFTQFHRTHPQVFEYFKQHSLKAIEREFKNYSATAIMQVIKWQLLVEAKSSRYKGLQIDYGVNYAKMFSVQHPAHVGFFAKKGT